MTDECRMLELESENARLRAELENIRKTLYHKTFTPAFKENVREHFGRKCTICGKPETEFKRKLSIHHVDKDVATDCYTSRMVPLCGKCHSRVHTETEKCQYWVDFFTTIINQFGGKCCDVKSHKDIPLKTPKSVVKFNKIKNVIKNHPSFNENRRVSEKALIKFISRNTVSKKSVKGNHYKITKYVPMRSFICNTIDFLVDEELLQFEMSGDKKFYRRVAKDIFEQKCGL